MTAVRLLGVKVMIGSKRGHLTQESWNKRSVGGGGSCEICCVASRLMQLATFNLQPGGLGVVAALMVATVIVEWSG